VTCIESKIYFKKQKAINKFKTLLLVMKKYDSGNREHVIFGVTIATEI
jgi:hypothetical protein